MRLALLLAGLLPAAPVPPTPAPLPADVAKQLQADALSYAQQLLSAVTQVSASYIRPVPRPELLRAALAGLHEAARQPLPPGLDAELAKGKADEDLVKLLAETRLRLGVGEGLAERAALLASCRAMLRSLDPWSDVVTDEDRKDQPWGDQPAYLGLELEGTVAVGPQRVRKVWPGTPAQRAGIRPGDRLTHLDDKPVAKMSGAQVAGLLKGRSPELARVSLSSELLDAGSPDALPATALRLERTGKAPWRVKLEHQMSKPEAVLGVLRNDDNSWDFLADRAGKIAHVRVETLHRGVAAELAGILARLEAAEARGVILDLRWSAGGFLDEAVGVAGLFLGDVPIATVRNRRGVDALAREETVYRNTQPRRFEKIPLVVLVNGQTTGGSELIAAALEDAKRAAIAGQRTLGKATVQSALYIDVPGTNLKLTSGEFARPSGKQLHRQPGSTARDEWGVKPAEELEYRLSPQLAQALRDDWLAQTLRPGGDRGILPLDDPSADPQRQLALDWLRKKLGEPKAAMK